MFEVLVYLFENYFEAEIRPDQTTLEQELSAAGFEAADISRAFDWFFTLEEMTQHIEDAAGTGGSLRIFSETETKRIHAEALGFLLFLEQAGVIGPALRELALDRAMALSEGEVTLDQFKWIMLMTLWTQDKASDYLFVEDAFFSDSRAIMH